MTALFDTHAHYDDKKFDEDRDQLLSTLRDKSEENPFGVEYVVNCASDIESAKACIALSNKYDFIYAAVGVHPHEASGFDDNTLVELAKLYEHKKVVAIGEAGLDFHYDFSPRDKQKEVFAAQLDLARSLNAPMIVHDREAHGPTVELIKQCKGVRGILHSFSGSAEMAREVVSLGFYVSYSGSVTFKNAVNLTESIKGVPLDRLLIETDSPYLAPVPYRGRRNNSSLMYATAAKLAELYGVSIEKIVEITSKNAKTVYNIC